jgi:pimeloyl-ACP methyl ester carboxylesterase
MSAHAYASTAPSSPGREVKRRLALACYGATLAISASLRVSPAYATEISRPRMSIEADRGRDTYVLLSGLVGGVAGYRPLEALLLRQGKRVIIIDPYRLSIDSADVSFAALARRVDAVLARQGVTSAIVVGHAHGGGVALRLAANSPDRVHALYLLDVGALETNHSPIFSASLRLIPVITHVPGGDGFVQARFIRALRQNSGRQGWLDSTTQREFAEPLLRDIGRVIALGQRLAASREPEPLSVLLARVHVPVTVVLGDAPHEASPGPEEMNALVALGTLLRIEHLPGIGHFMQEEAPIEVARILLVRQNPTVARLAVAAP